MFPWGCPWCVCRFFVHSGSLRFKRCAWNAPLCVRAAFVAGFARLMVSWNVPTVYMRFLCVLRPFGVPICVCGLVCAMNCVLGNAGVPKCVPCSLGSAGAPSGVLRCWCTNWCPCLELRDGFAAVAHVWQWGFVFCWVCRDCARS